MGGYNAERLAGPRLRQVYALASPRICEHIEAETRFVIDRVRGADWVLELGCGYGRAMRQVVPHVGRIAGNDISMGGLAFGVSHLRHLSQCNLLCMDASRIVFRDGTFDPVFRIQNGISAFGVDKGRLVEEAVRVARGGRQILFSSYSPAIWDDRLEWFRSQTAQGLLGEINEERTGNGTIVCKDGFRATTVEGDEFTRLFVRAGLRASLHEVDGSSLFAVTVKAPNHA